MSNHEEVECWSRRNRVLITKKPHAYKTCRAFRSYLTNAKSYHAGRKRGRLSDDGHEGVACLQDL
jgi:hypothetical protein